MERILVIFTGGTISSRKNQDQERDVDIAMSYKLLSDFRFNKNAGKVEFSIIEAYNILSENCCFNHWQILADRLFGLDLEAYKGIIIAHGSDTLAYSAAFVSFLMGACNKPIVFVASNHPLDNPLSSGQINFNSAISFILNSNRCGVYVVYRNLDGEPRVYLGTRLIEADRYTDDFSSFGGIDYGYMEGDKFNLIEHINNPRHIFTRASGVERLDLKRNVLIVKPYPSQDFSTYCLNDDVAAVLCILYHSSTICTDSGDERLNERLSFNSLLKRCKAKGVDVYLCSFKNDAEIYKGAGALMEEGAIPLYNISVEAAYAKLCIAYNSNVDAREFLKHNIFFEHIK